MWIDDGLATYPLLVNGSGVGSDYGVGQDHFFVIDHEGIVRYRSGAGPLGKRFVEGEIREAVEASLEDLADFLEAEEVPQPRTLTILSGDEQQAAAGASLAEPFVVSVLDQNGDPLAGATVTFAVTAGEGTLSATTAATDADGHGASTP